MVCPSEVAKDPFNELLSLCYLSGQELNFHSDNETGLGSVIASLSLGEAATMHFRATPGPGKSDHSWGALSVELHHVRGNRKSYSHPTNIGL